MTSLYFTTNELSCKCSCGFTITNEQLLHMLDTLRAAVGQPLIIASGARCKEHNRKIGGSKKSAHMLGLAVDIVCADSRLRDKVLKASYEVGFRRREWGTPTWIHLDIADDPDHPQDVCFPFHLPT